MPVNCTKNAIEYNYVSIISNEIESPMGPVDDNGLIGPLGAVAQRIFNKDDRRPQGLRNKL